MTAPVVLLPPLGSDATFWTPVLPLIEGSVSLDLLGQGDAADLSHGAGVDQLGEGVLAQLDVLGLTKVSVVGISLGGLVGQWLAANHPDRVSSLVLVDTVAQYPPSMQTMWHHRAATVRADGIESIIAPTLTLWFTEPYRAAGSDVIERAKSGLRAGNPEAYARTCELLETVDTRSLLSKIVCPTLVACGDQDAEPFRRAVVVFADAIQDARVAWLPGGHAAAVENPSVFADVVGGFLRSLNAAAAPGGV